MYVAGQILVCCVSSPHISIPPSKIVTTHLTRHPKTAWALEIIYSDHPQNQTMVGFWIQFLSSCQMAGFSNGFNKMAANYGSHLIFSI
jgi:hypothetical protein